MMGIMKDNISKVLERGEKLTDLEEKSGMYSLHVQYLGRDSYKNVVSLVCCSIIFRGASR